MDQSRFDDLLRVLTATTQRSSTRRSTLAALVSLLLASAESVTEAKKGKKPCKGGKTRCDGVCVTTQTDAANCGKCGKTCKNGKVCRGGQCVCRAGQSPCADFCCKAGLSCVNDIQCVNLCPPGFCPNGQACAEGACFCPSVGCEHATPPQADGVLPGACFCVDDPDQQSFCVPPLSCNNPTPPACGVDGSCPSGLICQDNGCGTNPTCVPTCTLS
jgi:Stigma-specific protein, Stig1